MSPTSSPMKAEPDPDETAASQAVPGAGRGRRIATLAALALMLLGGGIFGYREISFYSHHAETDDAQIEGHIAPVLPRVSGFITEVKAVDNQRVHAGELLLRIDPKDLQAKVDQESAALANAQAAVEVARANAQVTRATAQVAKANTQAARTRSTRDTADELRYAALRAKEEVSQQQFDTARSNAETSAAQVSAGDSQVTSAQRQVVTADRQVAAAEAVVAQRRADLAAAEIQLSYATLPSPADGIVSKKNVEVGQFVQAGQPLLAVVSDGDVWVTANFKETQLAKMRVGQTATIQLDAYPGANFRGRVDSFAAATGAKFSLLPPDNATGNFTKVVQRVPVKIVFTDPADPARPLRMGMNVNVIVNLD